MIQSKEIRVPKEMFRQSRFVDLTDEDIAFAKRLGNERCAAKPEKIRYNNAGYHRESSKDRALPHRIGLLGEIAYAKVTGRSVDTTILEGGDDCDFGNVEVKTATFKGKDVKLAVRVKEWERKKPSFYVLVSVNSDILKSDSDVSKRVELIGEISAADFDKKKWIENFGNGDNYVVDKHRLCTVRSRKSVSLV